MPKALIGRDGRTIMQIADREFPVHPVLRWVDVPENVTPRWSYDGERFVPPSPEPPPEPPRANTLERLIAVLERKGILEPGEIETR